MGVISCIQYCLQKIFDLFKANRNQEQVINEPDNSYERRTLERLIQRQRQNSTNNLISPNYNRRVLDAEVTNNYQNSISNRAARLISALDSIHRRRDLTSEQKQQLRSSLLNAAQHIVAQDERIDGCNKSVVSEWRECPGQYDLFQQSLRNSIMTGIRGSFNLRDSTARHRNQQLERLDSILVGVESSNNYTFQNTCRSLTNSSFTLGTREIYDNFRQAVQESSQHAQTQVALAEGTERGLRIAQEGLAISGGLTTAAMGQGYSSGYRGIQMLQNGTESLANLAYGTEQGAEQAARRLTSHSIGFATDRLPGPLSSFTQNLSEQVIINRRSLEEIDYAAAATDSLVSHGVNKGFVRVAGRGAPTNATLGVGNVLGNIAGNQAGNLVENLRVNDAISSLARDIRRRGTNFL